MLKKFGLYVLIQAAYPLLASGAREWAWVMAVLALFNVVFIGFVTMAQRDLKMMVAYSSVAHMGICFLGLASMSVLGAGGTVLMMFGHGASVALMLMLSTIIVNRTGEGLIFFGNVILPFVDDFPKDNELYSIMTTKLGETGKGENEHE